MSEHSNYLETLSPVEYEERLEEKQELIERLTEQLNNANKRNDCLIEENRVLAESASKMRTALQVLSKLLVEEC